LLGSAESITRRLGAFVQKNPPGAANTAERVLLEVSSVGTCLARLRRLIEGNLNTTRNHIFVDQLSTVLTGAVKRFSELESLIGDGLPTIRDGESHSLDAARWARTETRMRKTAESLQPYKLSLLLVSQLLEV